MEGIELLQAKVEEVATRVRTLKNDGKDFSAELEELKVVKIELSACCTKLLPQKLEELEKLTNENQDSDAAALLEKEISVIRSGIIEDKKAKKKREKLEKAAAKPTQATLEGSCEPEKRDGLSKKELNKLKRKEKKSAAVASKDQNSVPATSNLVCPSQDSTKDERDLKIEAQHDFFLSSAVVASLVGNKSYNGSKTSLNLGKGRVLCTDCSIARYLSRKAASDGKIALYGETDMSPNICASEVDQWIEYSMTESLDRMENVLFVLNEYLLTHTYLAGHSISLADVTIWARLVKGFKECLPQKYSDSHPNVYRWFSMLLSIPEFEAALKSYLKSLAPESAPGASQKDKSKSSVNTQAKVKSNEPSLPALKEAKDGEVVTRFPPEPSGHLHIGHVKALFLNKAYASKYKGKMLLRFDDTNPSKEKTEYEEGIKEDVKALGVEFWRVSHTSDHFDLIIKYAVQLISEGNAYMDSATQQEMSELRRKGEDTPARDQCDSAEALPLFFAMVFGEQGAVKCEDYGVTLDKEQEKILVSNADKAFGYCLRAKIDLATRENNRGNKALYDPVFFRGSSEPHARTGNKYRAYPTYDFACPIVDSFEGVTHAMRDIQYFDRIPLYEWVFNVLKIRKVRIQDFSRMNFQYTLLSKRKLKWFVEEGRVAGWDDPRFPTVKGMIRRGMHIDALFDFMVLQGASRHVVDMEWDKFWNMNKKYIDPVAPRYNAISNDKFVRVKIFDVDGVTVLPSKVLKVPLLPKDKTGSQFGLKDVELGESVLVEAEDLKGPVVEEVVVGEKIVLLGWGVIEVLKVCKNGDKIESVEAKIDPNGDFKKPKKKLQWVTESSKNTKVVIHEFDFLVKIARPETDKENPAPEVGSKAFEQCLRETTEATTSLIGESALADTKVGGFLQLQRRGYFRCDSRDETGAIHLFMIPDGKQKAMSTLTTKLEHR